MWIVGEVGLADVLRRLDRLGTTVATAGRAADRLVAHELVTRHQDPDDRRARQVSLSARAGQVVSGIDEARHQAPLAFARSLDPRDADRSFAALRPIAGTPPLTPQPLEEQPA